MRPTLFCALLALLGACASTQWAKDGGEVATPRILTECSHQAWGRAQYEDLSNPTYVSMQNAAGARTGRIEVNSNQGPPMHTGIQEQTLFNLCMREKGYDLVPAAPAP